MPDGRRRHVRAARGQPARPVDPTRGRRFRADRRARRRPLCESQCAVGVSSHGVDVGALGETTVGGHDVAADRPVRVSRRRDHDRRRRGRRRAAGGALPRHRHAYGSRRAPRDRAAAGGAVTSARCEFRCRGADPRRHRGQASRPRTDQQGRHDPGNSSPGQEQPAVGVRTFASAGTSHVQRGSEIGTRRGCPTSGSHRDRARVALGQRRRRGRHGRGRLPVASHDGRRRRRGDAGVGEPP